MRHPIYLMAIAAVVLLWICLFTLAPISSPQARVEGTFLCVAFGVIGGSIYAAVHKALAAAGYEWVGGK